MPVLGVAFVDAEQKPFTLLPGIGETLEIDDCRHLPIERTQLGYGFGDEVMVLHRHDRQVDAGHDADPPGPEACSVDDMFGRDRARLGDDRPRPAGVLMKVQYGVAENDIRAPFAGRRNKGMRRTGGVEVAVVRIPQPAVNARGLDDRAKALDLVRRDQGRVVKADGVERRFGGTEPLPSLGGPREGDGAGEFEPQVVVALGLQVAVEPDRIALQSGDVGVGVDGVESRGRVPRRPGRQFTSLQEGHLPPA